MTSKISSLILCLLMMLPWSLTYASLDFSLVQRFAVLSDDTYLDSAELAQRLDAQDQRLIHQSLITQSQVSYFLSDEGGTQTIAIRGTANLENAMLDLNIALNPNATLGIKLHQGFDAGAKAVYDDIKPFLDRHSPIHLTGHSLGGAIAVILALYLQQDGYDVTQVVTFGQPKVTNVTGANRYKALPLLRVVTLEDIVPLVPPISPLQIKELDIFWHIGEEIILMDKQTYSQTNGVKAMLRATKFTTSIPSDKNLNAHRMSTYLTLLESLQTTPKKVPYKTNINVFGFSFD
ncbi:lipase family protein [Marinomonas sp. IMCC 4694]|uniref:lipase family protein n=1 Tax=Marinomonas sp. IMCC 4694 TaxID=2605432 RepID=UPI0011E6100D|nr:lipase family protein [Marinomonas sp. IMCC 4694]TYL48014.1 lipase family protein [Marinomonas sp. IMCC 4694]